MNKFITSIEKRNIDSKLKNLPEIKPSLNSVKITTIPRYLEGSIRRIIIDNDGHIIWIRQHNADRLSFAEVANFKGSFGNLLSKKIGMMKIKYFYQLFLLFELLKRSTIIA